MTEALRGWRRGEDPAQLIRREWLVTNGLGGYASGTLAGASTRRYHGLLIANLPAPLGRYEMLNHLEERIYINGQSRDLTGHEPMTGGAKLPEPDLLEEFRLEHGLPVWEFSDGRVHLTKSLMLPYRENTTWITYHLDAASPSIQLTLSPSVHFRPHEQAVAFPLTSRYSVTFDRDRLRISDDSSLPQLRIDFFGPPISFQENPRVIPELLYRVEKSRGYEHAGALWNPGTITAELKPGQTLRVRCTVGEIEVHDAIDPLETELQRRRDLLAQAGVDPSDSTLANLVYAADQFIITPESRKGEALRARSFGAEPRTIIAGYHWFTDWGRDTMISLEGLTLSTGRTSEARSILTTFVSYVRDGLIPNMFPEGENEGLYHTADATLWFFHAVDRYLTTTGDRETLHRLLPALNDIIDHHVHGTRFGIGVDSRDGLLRQGAEGYQLTWMDAKVDGWVVTPRRGKAVEINALFYNALMLLEGWTRESNPQRASELREAGSRLRGAFNERFWFEEGNHLFDVIDGADGSDDPALRPNQIFSLALRHAVLDESRWRAVVDAVERELLTPFGLRSLSPSHPDYKRTYDGDLRTRDAAYHQGTVWSWLIGPFINAYRRTYPDRRDRAREMLEGLVMHLADAGVGSVSEIFDAEDPYEPRGCIAQAWGVAELLRCLRLESSIAFRDGARVSSGSD